MLHGCAVERTVKDNRVYSSYPRLQVVVNKEFKYLGSDVFSSQVGGKVGENAFFYFIPEKPESNTIRKGVLIETTDTKLDSRLWVHYPVIDEKAKNVIKYEEDSLVIVTRSDDKSEPSKWLIKKGYMNPQCMFQYRIFSFGNATHKYVTYFEDPTLTGLNCNLWWDKYKYSSEQKSDIEEFIQRAKKALTIEKF
jgi:hypothetical protein